MNLNKVDIAAGSDTILFNDPMGCATFKVSVPLASSYGIGVYVTGVHRDNRYVPVFPGEIAYFASAPHQITKVVAQGDGGTATDVGYGVAVRNKQPRNI
jgi:hypothetical protein